MCSKIICADRRRRELVFPLRKEFPTIFGPANRARSASKLTHSSKGTTVGAKI